MTLKDLRDHADRGTLSIRDLRQSHPDDLEDLLLSLRQVAAVTGEPYERVRYWVYTDRSMPIVRVGPNAKPRVRASTVLRMFSPQEEAPSKPVAYFPSRLRPCTVP